MRKALLFLILIIAVIPLLAKAVVFREEIKHLQTLYQRGDIVELGRQLNTLVANNKEESSLLLYMNAILKTRKTETAELLRQCSTKFPDTYYGQISMLELAKLHILDRETAEAKALLQKISSTEIMERYYWLAVCAEIMDDHELVIANCENYFRLAPLGPYTEDAYFLITETYLNQGKYQSAISTLNKLRSLSGYPRAEQYFYYLLGLMHQLSKNPREAVANYKKGLELNKVSQIAFQIEDKLFELKDKYPSSVDLSFLYPYSDLDIAMPTEITTGPANNGTLPPHPTTMKLDSKPSGGYFLQVGRFGVETNANKMSLNIRELELSSSYFEDKDNKSVPWVVVSGPYQTKNEAQMVRQALVDKGINCFITQY